jgi:SAM-dependent methyltransferase
MQPTTNLKNDVKNYWNAAACGTEFINQPKYSLAYFQAIEAFRYTVEPEIFSFAQFTRFHDKKVLEVGVGAGTDFLQWVRAGAHAHGIDLTEEAVAHVTNRLALYNLAAADIRVGDAEKLPYPNDSFDLVYSWGVIHHAPDTLACLQEIIRVTKPGGVVKVMIYNRRSLFALYRYLQSALFKGKPFQSIKQVLYLHQESPGTKAFTVGEVKKMLAPLPVTVTQLKAPVTQHDLLYYKARPFRWMAYALACLFGWNRVGWFMMIELEKKA